MVSFVDDTAWFTRTPPIRVLHLLRNPNFGDCANLDVPFSEKLMWNLVIFVVACVRCRTPVPGPGGAFLQ